METTPNTLATPQKDSLDLDLESLLNTTAQLESQLQLLKETLGKIITADPVMKAKKKLVKRLIGSTIPVLIQGETGTGKELFARALHAGRKGKFVAVNTAGVPDTLLESAFFGAVKGAYTGCDSDRKGYLEEAEGGTIFLDEIGDMHPLLQVKLLRALQDGSYMKVGGAREQVANVRFIAATNRMDLLSKSGSETKTKSKSKKSQEESFRSDLYYRLAGAKIKLPPLRERSKEDIKLLVESYPGFSHRTDKEQVIEYLISKIYPQPVNPDYNNIADNEVETILTDEEFSYGNVRSVMNFLRIRSLYKQDEPIEEME